MQSFGTASPSLHKMDMDNSGHFGRPSGGFKVGNIIGDPFSLATIGIAICGWLIAFVSSIIADIGAEYPNFCWWSLVYMFGCIVLVFVTVATNSVYTYHVAIVGFLAAGLVFTTSSVNSLIYYSDGSKEAGAAGFILLSMVAIVWIFYYGSQPQASHRQTLDSFALHKDRAVSRTASRHMTQSYAGARPETTRSSTQPPQMYNSAQLAGFETSSPVTGFAGGRPGEMKRDDNTPFSNAAPLQNNQNNTFAHPPLQQQQQQPQSQPSFAPSAIAGASALPSQPSGPQQQPQPDSSVSQPTEYPYRAKAIYNYEANPDDANEISFAKHEILEVSDVSGRWWQAKKENGETGIAPSNYLILL